MLRSTTGIRSSVQPTACLPIRSSMVSMCSETPSTRPTVNSATGGAASASRSARLPPVPRPRSSDSYSTSSARLRALLRADTGQDTSGRAAEVVPGTGVDLDLLAGGEEQRDLDRVPGLELGRLGAAGGPVALQARLGVLDRQLDGGRELDVQRGAVVYRDDGGLVLQEEVRGVAHGLRRDVALRG